MNWIKDNRARIMDFFRRQDKDHDGKISREEFIEGILQSSKKSYFFFSFLFLLLFFIYNIFHVYESFKYRLNIPKPG